MSHLFDLTANFREEVVIKKMGILRSSNVLYYSYEPVISDAEYYKVAFVSLEDANNSGILNVTGPHRLNFGFFDINQNEDSIYLGGSDGIYVLNTKTHKISSYSSIGDTITNVVLKDYLYFSKMGDKGITKKKGDEFNIILEDDVVKNFVLDKEVEYIVVYLKSTGLYAYDSKTGKKVRLSKNAFFRGLTVDLDGVVYAWWIDSLYKVTLAKDIAHSKIDKVADIPSIGSMMFDNENNILFTSDKSLFRLVKTAVTNC